MSFTDIERVWYDMSVWARVARLGLAPFSALFGVGVAMRNRAYDRGMAEIVRAAIPVISVGNLTVGGTGKTPVAAWLVHMLRARGRHPAVVMRGYGDDEPLVHRILSPGVPVYVNRDRASGIAEAAMGGADVVVLDDGFQHRRAMRRADLVLVSADRWPAGGHVRLLPAGPFREPLSSLKRSTLAIVTAKAASNAQVRVVTEALQAAVPGLRVAAMRFTLGPLRELVAGLDRDPGGTEMPLDVLAGARVLAISAIGDPSAFRAQLAALGALVTVREFRDHHAYTAEDVAELTAAAAGHKYVISTLKDAVKLAPLWPAKAPRLWYVSQVVTVTEGDSFIGAQISDVLSD